MTKGSRGKKNLIAFTFVMCILFAVFFVVYKSQVEYDGDDRLVYTLMATHKDNGKTELSKDNTEIYEDFICRVSDLRSVIIEGKVKKPADDCILLVEVTGLDSGTTYYKKEAKLSSFYNTRLKKKSFKLKGLPDETNGMVVRLHIKLIEPGEKTRLILTANNKPGTVMGFEGSVDGISAEYANVIYRMKYGRVSELSVLFAVLCAMITITVCAAYYIIIVKKVSCREWFPLIAILLGVIVQVVIPVYGVPDEPWHMDTAYQVANTIMRVDKEPQANTILKRECDIITADLLANDVESNSYYQLSDKLFEKADDTAYRRVSYVDSGIQVPRVVYAPAALGICTGRLLKLSGMMVYELARLFNLIVYVLIMWLAVKIMPFCNNLMAMCAVSMIALQQAGSASYDAMINPLSFLFIAACLRLTYGNDNKHNRKDIIIMIITAALISVVKGGAYIPILLLALLLTGTKKRSIIKRGTNGSKSGVKAEDNKANKMTGKVVCYIICIIAALCCIGLAMWKFRHIFGVILSGAGDAGKYYTPAYIIRHPIQLIYLLWGTFIKYGDNLLSGMFGGMLGWHNIKVSWVFIVPMIICLLLLVHVENERPYNAAGYRALCLLISFITIILTMMGMLFTLTEMDEMVIRGVQGRYFIPIEVLMLSAFSTPMVTVSRDKALRIDFILIVIELLALVQVAVISM